MPVVPSPVPTVATDTPCVWPAEVACCAGWDDFTPEVQGRALSWATEILYALSGRQFGSCPVTVRPCGSTCNFGGGWMTFPVGMDGASHSGGAGGWFPYVDRSGVWRNCACPGACSCRASCEVWLPGPVQSVSEVVVDGLTLDPDAYRVDNHNTLVRTDGECWPECQDFDLTADTEPGTFFVTYQRGKQVPVGGQIAAGILACEFAKSCTSGCVLPGNLASLSRQGVDVEFVSPTDVLTNGLTGIADVDLWLRSVNPYRRTQRARVYSPDINYPRVVS